MADLVTILAEYFRAREACHTAGDAPPHVQPLERSVSVDPRRMVTANARLLKSPGETPAPPNPGAPDPVAVRAALARAEAIRSALNAELPLTLIVDSSYATEMREANDASHAAAAALDRGDVRQAGFIAERAEALLTKVAHASFKKAEAAILASLSEIARYHSHGLSYNGEDPEDWASVAYKQFLDHCRSDAPRPAAGFLHKTVRHAVFAAFRRHRRDPLGRLREWPVAGDDDDSERDPLEAVGMEYPDPDPNALAKTRADRRRVLRSALQRIHPIIRRLHPRDRTLEQKRRAFVMLRIRRVPAARYLSRLRKHEHVPPGASPPAAVDPPAPVTENSFQQHATRYEIYMHEALGSSESAQLEPELRSVLTDLLLYLKARAGGRRRRG